MIDGQRSLSDFLQCELYHLLGAYGVAEEHLNDLADRIREEATVSPRGGRRNLSGKGSGSAALAKLVDLSRDYNHKLSWDRYASEPRSRANAIRTHGSDLEAWPVREPLPDDLPMTEIKRFTVGPKGKSVSTSRAPWVSDEEWERVPQFYREAIAALKSHREVVGSEEDRYDEETGDEANQNNFARSLVAPRDGASEWTKQRAAREHLERRIDRYTYRLEQALRDIGGTQTISDGRHTRSKADEKFLQLIVNDDLSDGDESLSAFVLRTHTEAHLSMHAVEAWRSMCLGEHADAVRSEEKDWLKAELDRSIALSTFAFSASRTAPWIFAKSEEESASVIRDVSAAWENVVPIRCMWIASQVSLLSLHRRAYARALRNDSPGAYNDYHKLQYLIRDTERRVGQAPLHVEGALEFLTGLNAEAHHHIGELYRSEHAHRPALEHFEAASHRLDLLRKDKTFDRVLTNSRWHVELQISRGKACYEMGRHKEALCWHLRAWQTFLELLSSETKTETNTTDIEEAIDWLESVKFEPELRKSEISKRIGPVVDQLDRITTVGRLGALAAEILLRLGHLLFVLNLGHFNHKTINEPAESPAREQAAKGRIRRTLAFACLSKALECDPYSTLVGTDLMKTRYRFNTWWDGELPEVYKSMLASHPLQPVANHWPRGGDDYERLARVAEYLMLKAREGRFEEGRNGNSTVAAIDALLARDLLLDLFMSTDSINVRKSQIHRFLMKPKLDERLPRGHRAPAIEFICMRRYSSPFPLLPRPSAFRALGGGYFIRLHSADNGDTQGTGEGPFGVVVDPGVDFVENLYRTGYSLGDIDMIAITHDHVDHLGALDPLLSLLHVRAQILDKQAAPGDREPSQRKVTVLTSRSVFDRYQHVKRLRGPDAKNFEFCCFEEGIEPLGGVVELDSSLGFPSEFEIVAMSSAAGARLEERNMEEDGHRDLSEQPSHGLCFRLRDESSRSVAVTSDTPPPPPATAKRRHKEWRKTWAPALDADILVVHLGSIPLTELRRMDDYDRATQNGVEGVQGERLEEDEAELHDMQRMLQEADPHLQGQVEYAQWLRSHAPKDPVKTAGIVGPVPTNWLPPPEHNYLAGLLRWARVSAEMARPEKPAGDARNRRAERGARNDEGQSGNQAQSPHL